MRLTVEEIRGRLTTDEAEFAAARDGAWELGDNVLAAQMEGSRIACHFMIRFIDTRTTES
ncbi:hypothetical protein Uis1B_2107 [Bifidobacterium margollesii]|uniref:Uncharacterized protein n=1 Tax=Bifidobacterium margollesii TaxID=2020964 RepID=A0A2N5J773_9BIFI|nr:hypothetical protein [Bifidobacterium margollesii]PLS30056.1 hypothetical protein Uis1B_2107 [Bifidobacterium margollesii]